MASLVNRSPDVDMKIFQLDKTAEVIKKIKIDLGDIIFKNQEVSEEDAQAMAAMQTSFAKVHNMKEV